MTTTSVDARGRSTAAQRGANPAPQDRDIQRAALGDLVALATECAATEAAIEQRHQSAVAAARRTQERAEQEIAERHELQRAEVGVHYEEQVKAAEGKLRTEWSALEEAAEPRRDTIQSEAD